MSSKNISRDGEKPNTYSFELALGVLIVLLFLTIFLSIKYYECYSDKKNCDNLSNLSKTLYNYNKTKKIEFSAKAKTGEDSIIVTDEFGTILVKEIKLTTDKLTYIIDIPEDAKKIMFKSLKNSNLSNIEISKILIDGKDIINNFEGLIYEIN